MSGINKPDEILLELAELCSEMVKLCSHFISKTSVGMYYTLVYDTTMGTDCDYAQRTQRAFWEQQKDSIVKQLTSLNTRLTHLLKRIENHG